MKTESKNVFGDWLRKAIESKRMSAGEFSQRAKVSRAAVYFWLDGKRVPDEEALQKIVTFLGVPPEEIPPFERKQVGRPRVS